MSARLCVFRFATTSACNVTPHRSANCTIVSPGFNIAFVPHGEVPNFPLKIGRTTRSPTLSSRTFLISGLALKSASTLTPQAAPRNIGKRFARCHNDIRSASRIRNYGRDGHRRRRHEQWPQRQVGDGGRDINAGFTDDAQRLQRDRFLLPPTSTFASPPIPTAAPALAPTYLPASSPGEGARVPAMTVHTSVLGPMTPISIPNFLILPV